MGHPLRVLLIEDSEDDALLLERELKRAEFEPTMTRVENEPDTTRALAEGTYDLVIADYSLPGYGGMDAFRIVRKHDPEIPFLLISGVIGEEKAVEAMRMGISDYLLKDRLTRLPNAIALALRDAETRRSHRQAVEDLARSEDQYRMTLDSIADAIHVVGPDLRVQIINRTLRTWCQELGLELTPIGKRIDEAFPFLPRSVVEEYEQVFRDGKMLVTNEVTVVGGQELVTETRKAPILRGAEVERVVTVIRDITEQRSLEEQLRHAQKMEAVGRLAGGIAHDFNNLLTGIGGYTRLLMHDSEEGSSQHQDLREINGLVDRAARLTRDLLAFSRKQTLKPRVLNVNELVTNLSKMLQRLIGENIELKVITSEHLSNVRADPVQIEQTLLNLAINARDAMPEGGTLIIETRNVFLDEEYANTHRSAKTGPYVMLAVSDTGCGMDEETRERAFEPFFTTKEQGQGTGLGLSTVYGIVKQHGGNIWLYSEEGEGTTFKIYLPSVDSCAASLKDEETPAAPLTGNETIMVVEDEDIVRAVAVRALESAGFTTIAAGTAEEADRLFRGYGKPIHLLLTDVVLPGRNGRELADALRETSSDLRVLFMSGYTDHAIVHHGELDEGTDLIEKPFTPADLTGYVRKLLDA